ncbi:MAG: DUF6084 family protein [Mycobacteriales bacterium]
MAELVFDCVDARSDRYAAGPTLNFRLRIAETSGDRIHAIALRCQLRIEPQKRRYSSSEADHLGDLFGDQSRWATTLKPLQFAYVSVMVPSFTGSTEIDLPVPCTYDLEIASTSYFHALSDGEIPLLLLFSGTMFTKGETGFTVGQVPWHKETNYRLPVAEWRAMMDGFFPNSGWLRLHRETLEALGAFKNARALPTFEQTITALLDEAAASTDHPA